MFLKKVIAKGPQQFEINVFLLQMLQLHPLLSPYQVAMSVTGSKSREVRVLAEHVAKELREAGISVLSSPGSAGAMDAQYKRYAGVMDLVYQYLCKPLVAAGRLEQSLCVKLSLVVKGWSSVIFRSGSNQFLLILSVFLINVFGMHTKRNKNTSLL